MSEAVLTINSRRYGAWSLRGWLICRYAGIDLDVQIVDSADPDSRAELHLLSPSFLVPALHYGDVTIWDTLAIGEYLHEVCPSRALYPEDPGARALCRSVSGEVHSGFANLRSALPMNVTSVTPGFPLWASVKPDLDRVEALWGQCLEASGGPYLFGSRPTIADAMYAPECTRVITYDVALGPAAMGYVKTMTESLELREWTAAAADEDDDIDLEFEF
jgi:glutathione S-transferase